MNSITEEEAKKEAIELVKQFVLLFKPNYMFKNEWLMKLSKQCALICINENETIKNII